MFPAWDDWQSPLTTHSVPDVTDVCGQVEDGEAPGRQTMSIDSIRGHCENDLKFEAVQEFVQSM